MWPWTLTYQKLFCVFLARVKTYKVWSIDSYQKLNMYIYWFSSEWLQMLTTTLTMPDTTVQPLGRHITNYQKCNAKNVITYYRQLLSNEPACIHCNTLPLLTFARWYCKALLLPTLGWHHKDFYFRFRYGMANRLLLSICCQCLRLVEIKVETELLRLPGVWVGRQGSRMLSKSWLSCYFRFLAEVTSGWASVKRL